MTAEQVKEDKVGNATLEKLYSAFPETKSFEIFNASNVQGLQTSITLLEKGGTGRKFTLHTNSITGEIEHVIQENWEPKVKPLIALTDQEIKAKVDNLIDIMYGHIEKYESTMEQMEDADQKTLMFNYTKKGSKPTFYQVFVRGNTISLDLIGGETKPSNMKVEGLLSRDGKPDYFADVYLNDASLLSLLQISPTELK
jgi:hypothetical protein